MARCKADRLAYYNCRSRYGEAKVTFVNVRAQHHKMFPRAGPKHEPANEMYIICVARQSVLIAEQFWVPIRFKFKFGWPSFRNQSVGLCVVLPSDFGDNHHFPHQ